ncbi:CPBP family intramembrane glutamic endopeptidase [[Clostridium] dakarense]|uniref:CPBP family intramembrane glutamic endopeptidase n=1 Tax=Faecalimicrobium dakarense TaxID=1301100 RepID=UPI0004B69FAA|nr:type II CAAX endopeptidase family protein [[Clostridium] dakarense]
MNKELKFYTALLIAISITFYTISIITTQLNILTFGTPIFMIIYGIAGYSPSIAAIITVKRYNRKTNEFKLFLKSIINIKQKPTMYLYTIFTPIILWVAAYISFKTQGRDLDMLRYPLSLIIFITPFAIIGGGLEEIGWRGFLLPKLLEKFSLIKATLIVGCVWSIWHIPMWFVVGSHQQKLIFLPFAISCIATSFIMTPLFYKTRSIWLCILLHAIDNACSYVFYASVDANLITSIFTLIVAILLFYIFKPYHN